MTNSIPITLPGAGLIEGSFPLIILGPNGSGKTRLAQQITTLAGDWTAIGAQRRTWLDDQLPVMEEQQQNNHLSSVQGNWRANSWQPTEDINYLFSKLAQEHLKRLSENNDLAINCNEPIEPITDTKLVALQTLWGRLYPFRKLEISGFFPRVTRTDRPIADSNASYQARLMSDGERTAIYLAARVLTAAHSKILIDEPELHMHSRLAIEFWSALEQLRPDCRFVYITHDLNFALSRREGKILTIRSDNTLEAIGTEFGEVANQVLGAATLPFHAKRIVFFEGEEGRGFASQFFNGWFNDRDTFALASGSRDAVCAAVNGLISVGVAGAEVLGIVDSDYYPDKANQALRSEIKVLQLHEIESVLCIKSVVKAISVHQAKNPDEIWNQFIDRIRSDFSKKSLSKLVATRVRCRITELLHGSFNAAQIEEGLAETLARHKTAILGMQLEQKMDAMFAEEEKRAKDALDTAEGDLLLLFPGKHLLSLLSKILGFSSTNDLTDLVIKALINSNTSIGAGAVLANLGREIENSLLDYLPPRIVTPSSIPESPQ
jgi:Protein of unknown function (DUF4435)/AAA domain, putative AbiEii toxin, Type IV TA system